MRWPRGLFKQFFMLNFCLNYLTLSYNSICFSAEILVPISKSLTTMWRFSNNFSNQISALLVLYYRIILLIFHIFQQLIFSYHNRSRPSHHRIRQIRYISVEYQYTRHCYTAVHFQHTPPPKWDLYKNNMAGGCVDGAGGKQTSKPIQAVHLSCTYRAQAGCNVQVQK